MKGGVGYSNEGREVGKEELRLHVTPVMEFILLYILRSRVFCVLKNVKTNKNSSFSIFSLRTWGFENLKSFVLFKCGAVVLCAVC